MLVWRCFAAVGRVTDVRSNKDFKVLTLTNVRIHAPFCASISFLNDRFHEIFWVKIKKLDGMIGFWNSNDSILNGLLRIFNRADGRTAWTRLGCAGHYECV